MEGGGTKLDRCIFVCCSIIIKIVFLIVYWRLFWDILQHLKAAFYYMGGYCFVLGPWDSDACSYWILYSLLYAQYGVVLEYDFLLLGSLSILIFFCVSVVFSHTESSFCVVGAFPFCFQRCCIAGFTGNYVSFSLFICVEQKNKCIAKD